MVLYFESLKNTHAIEAYLYEHFGEYTKAWWFLGSVGHYPRTGNEISVDRYRVRDITEAEIFMMRMKLDLLAVETDVVCKPFVWVTGKYAEFLHDFSMPVNTDG